MKKKIVMIGGLYMERNIKCKPNHLCMIIFMLCLSVRFVKYFLFNERFRTGHRVQKGIF